MGGWGRGRLKLLSFTGSQASIVEKKNVSIFVGSAWSCGCGGGRGRLKLLRFTGSQASTVEKKIFVGSAWRSSNHPEINHR